MSFSDYLATQAATYQTNLVVKTKALPAAGLTYYTDTINLWDAHPRYSAEDLFSARISFPAIGAMANSQSIVATLETSTDGVTFTDTANTVTVTGSGGIGSPATTAKFPLGTPAPQYSRFKIVASAGAGDTTQSVVTTDIFWG